MLKRFCEPDLETLTSTSQEPVGLSFNQKASGVNPPNTIFLCELLKKYSSASKTPWMKNVSESTFSYTNPCSKRLKFNFMLYLNFTKLKKNS